MGKKYTEEELKEKQRERCRKYYQKNKEIILEQHKQYYQDNKEEIDEKNKQYQQEHKEIILEHQKQYYQDNKEEIAEKKKQRYYTPIGRAKELRRSHIREDRKKGRISDELPPNYVTVEDVVRLITKKCAHFDECGTYGWRKIGLNRLDNSKPHTIDNVEPCCFDCNRRLR